MFGTGPALLLHYADHQAGCWMETVYTVLIAHGFGLLSNGAKSVRLSYALLGALSGALLGALSGVLSGGVCIGPVCLDD